MSYAKFEIDSENVTVELVKANYGHKAILNEKGEPSVEVDDSTSRLELIISMPFDDVDSTVVDAMSASSLKGIFYAR